jgi:hypothetical protein
LALRLSEGLGVNATNLDADQFSSWKELQAIFRGNCSGII